MNRDGKTEKPSPERNAMEVIGSVADQLCEPASLQAVWHQRSDFPLPSVDALAEILGRLKAAIFPGYFGRQQGFHSLKYHLTANLDSVYQLLKGQITAGLCFYCQGSGDTCGNCHREGEALALEFMAALPEIRMLLSGDAQAAYEGDPAAKSQGETIFCYPSLNAMFHHRIAHALYNLKVPVIPRIISEIAHSGTGIDIHPGAKIAENFFVDHGTGVVIGETAIIGKNCRLYQGVTLGALSFPKNPDGSLAKGMPRHPVLEDNVTVYAGATILGRITIGKNAVIGGNVWVTHDVPPNGRVTQERP